MSFYHVLLAQKEGFNRNLTWYWNLFARFYGRIHTMIASILKIKGNTLVFNQLVYDGNFTSSSNWQAGSNANVTISNNTIIAVPIDSGASGSRYFAIKNNRLPIYSNHEYLFIADAKGDSDFVFQAIQSSPWASLYQKRISITTSFQRVYHKFSPNANGSSAYFLINFDGKSEISMKNFQVIDLTQLASSYITDYASFSSYFPLSYYTYTTGTLVSFNGTGIKTTGKNLYQKVEWYRNNTGDPSQKFNNNTTRIKSDVFPLKKGAYVVSGYPSGTNAIMVRYYDADINFLGEKKFSNNTIELTESAIAYASMLFGGSDFTSDTNTLFYDADIQLEFGSSPTSYEAYTEKTTSFPISTYFPTGMKSAGSVYDELTQSKAYTKVGSVDLSTISSWTLGGGGAFWDCNAIPTIKSATPNLRSSQYVCDYASYFENNPTVIGFAISASQKIRFYNSGLTTQADVINALQGIMLYYELATPTETDVSLSLDYDMEWGGTEEVLPTNTSTPNTTPILADIKYPNGERDNQYFTYREIKRNG